MMKTRMLIVASGVLLASGAILMAMGDRKDDNETGRASTYSSTGNMMKGGATNTLGSTGGVWRSSMKGPASSSLLLAMGNDNNSSRTRSGTDTDLGTRSSERAGIYDSSRSSTGGVMRSGGVTNKWGTSDSDMGVRSSSGSGVGSDNGTMGTRTGAGSTY